ncbi:MAG: long-chain fatty acid--CoA ligase [Bacteroidota bacterium]
MEITRLFEVVHYQNENYPQERSLGRRDGAGWKFWSTQEIIDTANKASFGLLEIGIQPGDKIALISYVNRPEWNIMDIAISQIGAINVPVYPTISPREYEYIFNDAEVKLCIVGLDHPQGKASLLQKVRDAQPNVPSLKSIYTFDKTDDAPYWEELFKEGDMKVLEEKKGAINPDDLATLIYTSGTTGDPKGVMLSHSNIASNVNAVLDLVPLNAGDRVLSFLPLCHIFERNVSYTYMATGVSIYYTGTDNLGGEGGDLQDVKPHFFTTVPRLLEKVYEKIYNKGLDLEGFKRKLFFWALDLTDDYEYDKRYSGLRGIKNAIADKLIFSKWREALGGNIKGIITGAAACPPKMARVFSAAGIPIREGYGLTETSPALTIGRFQPGEAMLGTVGPTLPNVTIMIDGSDGDYKEGEGEILAKGPNVMQGYYRKPEATADVMHKDGWFHTGDIGKIVTNSAGREFLKITGRKKALLKTSGGKYVAPEPIEKKFKEDFLVEQMMVVGEGKKFVSALIVPAAEAVEDWCDNNDVKCITGKSANDPDVMIVNAETLENPKIQALFENIIKNVNPNFSHIEQVKKFVLLPEPWTVETGELTPTMKIKRRVIRQKYKSVIDEIYNV